MLKSGHNGSWKLSFGRKSSSSKKEEEWDDYDRGTAGSSAMNATRSMDSSRSRFTSTSGSSSLRKGSVVDDLMDTGYLPRTSSTSMRRDASSSLGPGRRSISGNSKLERMMGAGADAVALNSTLAMRRSESHRSVDPPASTSGSSLHDASTSYSNGDDSRTEADCPICLERLSYRLAGEKPHVMPTCGHALHNACFTAVYGKPEDILAAQEGGSTGRKAGPPGMCGVCRRAIVLGGDAGDSNRAASEYAAEVESRQSGVNVWKRRISDGARERVR